MNQISYECRTKEQLFLGEGIASASSWNMLDLSTMLYRLEDDSDECVRDRRQRQ